MPDNRAAIFFVLAVACASAQEGQFVRSGKMTTYRWGHTATLLKDGRVLITGGYPSSYRPLALASAELYDPAKGTFRATGSMAKARAGHAAVLLHDGRVLITGNDGPEVEIYDPVAETFSPAGFTSGYHLFGSTAQVLPDGKVLIVGPYDADLYDPSTGTFSWLGKVETGASSVLADGRVAISGYNTISIYDVKEGSLRPLEQQLTGSDWASRASEVLANGNLLIAGGSANYGEITSWEALLYDARRHSLKSTGLMLFTRMSFSLIRLPDGRMLITGGYNDAGYGSGQIGVPQAEAYDPATEQFTFVGLALQNRSNHTATLLPDGRVLIAGGQLATAETELYIPPLRTISAANLTSTIAPGSLASLFGSQLAYTSAAADLSSLPSTLGGISLFVRDGSGTERPARLLFVSPTQINFEVPAGTSNGQATVNLVQHGGEFYTTTVPVAQTAPGLFTLGNNTVAGYLQRVETGGKLTTLSVQQPIALDERPVYLVLYGTGIRNRSPLANIICEIGGIQVPVDYAGPEGSGVPGLDQVNLRLPSGLRGRGVIDVVLSVDGVRSNALVLEFQ